MFNWLLILLFEFGNCISCDGLIQLPYNWIVLSLSQSDSWFVFINALIALKLCVNYWFPNRQKTFFRSEGWAKPNFFLKTPCIRRSFAFHQHSSLINRACRKDITPNYHVTRQVWIRIIDKVCFGQKFLSMARSVNSNLIMIFFLLKGLFIKNISMIFWRSSHNQRNIDSV